jgi:hypothetical protein
MPVVIKRAFCEIRSKINRSVKLIGRQVIPDPHDRGMRLLKVKAREKPPVVNGNILCVIFEAAFVISELSIHYCVGYPSIDVQRESVILTGEFRDHSGPHIISDELAVVDNHLLIVIFISTEALLAMLDVQSPLNSRPINSLVLAFLAIIEERIFIQASVGGVEIRDRPIIQIQGLR